MARHFNVIVRGEVTMTDEDGIEHTWPWTEMGFPEQTQDELVMIQQQFKTGFVDPMYAKGPAKLEEKKRKK